MKLCKTCNEEKLESEFGVRVASNDGLCPKCRECQKIYDKTRANNPDRVKAREIYAKTEKGILAMDRARKKWAIENKEKIYQSTKRYRENNKKKSYAHGKVSYEIRLGRMTTQPCEICGAKGKIHAHHDDYSKPLMVRWLCTKHHNEWHKENGEGLNAN